MSTKQHNIYTDTPLLPYLIAEKVAGHYQNTEMVEYLVDRAERHYRDNEHFRKCINNKRYDPREQLRVFMEHWKKAKDQFNKFKKQSHGTH